MLKREKQDLLCLRALSVGMALRVMAIGRRLGKSMKHIIPVVRLLVR